MGYLVGPLRHSGLYCCHLMLCNGQTVAKCAAFASAHGTRGGEVSLSILIQMNMSAFSMAHVIGIYYSYCKNLQDYDIFTYSSFTKCKLSSTWNLPGADDSEHSQCCAARGPQIFKPKLGPKVLMIKSDSIIFNIFWKTLIDDTFSYVFIYVIMFSR